ncbi:hypothetical protein Cs7R123_17450 [Catellatospora sp. TT07R-123]|nr:hypothetical protein Cs7R123_17450 [Catellatospora sp. TT07R-123]
MGSPVAAARSASRSCPASASSTDSTLSAAPPALPLLVMASSLSVRRPPAYALPEACRALPSAAVRCRPLPSAAVRCRPLPSAAVRCRPLPSAAVRCRPLPSAAVRCRPLPSHLA